MDFLSENLRYLLWKDGFAKESWARRVANWGGYDPSDSDSEVTGRKWLQSGSLPQEVLEKISLSHQIGEDELAHSRLIQLDEVNVLAENIKLLMNSLKHGEKRQLAETLSVHPTTLSRWCNGQQRPEKAHLLGLSHYFRVQIDDLEGEVALFLELSAVSDQEKRASIHKLIDQLPTKELEQLYPVLQKLLS